jgi:hypothetical protein
MGKNILTILSKRITSLCQPVNITLNHRPKPKTEVMLMIHYQTTVVSARSGIHYILPL